ncbi:hypothetical protein E4O05_10995 [Treponema sp. OMZ 787]|uniref:hypothetical protein n=1 Tax=Treponema sp. OMZ 787 TaxID=2563669 RepID=UPI0020A4A7DC|nr:hypothetical protein [Treponema sp. OMZ 787]UTC62031.1 hypothetical protein E4O05_10995 [Treponema sp. OMZ 787]
MEILTFCFSVFLFFFLVSCNQLFDGIDDSFSYWANESEIVSISTPYNEVAKVKILI